MNRTDEAYKTLLRKILEVGKEKGDRTGTGTISTFSHTLELDMTNGFPLLTGKKMYIRGIIHELLWFLNGDTNIQYLIKNGVNIWTPDAYKKYKEYASERKEPNYFLHVDDPNKNCVRVLTMEEFKERIVSDEVFAESFGELGPVYGKQWTKWDTGEKVPYVWHHGAPTQFKIKSLNQIQNAIDTLNINPDSRRIIVSAWNVGDIPQPDNRSDDELYDEYEYKLTKKEFLNKLKKDKIFSAKFGRKYSQVGKMVLPPCHFGFQLYTEELTLDERLDEADKFNPLIREDCLTKTHNPDEPMELVLQYKHEWLDTLGVIPKRKISLKWHQRSVDVGLGLPFNIASYGFLLQMIAQQVNMVPDKLVGDLTNVHIYNNHIDAIKELLIREPYQPPTLYLNKAKDMFSYTYDDFRIKNYKSHPTLKMDISV